MYISTTCANPIPGTYLKRNTYIYVPICLTLFIILIEKDWRNSSAHGNILTIYEAISVSFPVFIWRELFILSQDGVGNCFGGCLIFIDLVSRFVYVDARRRRGREWSN